MLQVKIVPVTAFAQNCSLVWDSETKEAVLIDAGGDAAVLKKEVEALGLKVKALWLTHGHLDHAGAVGELAKEWSVPVVGPHKEDQFWLDMIQEVSARYGFPIPQPVKVDQWLEGGEVLKLGEDEFEVRLHQDIHQVTSCSITRIMVYSGLAMSCLKAQLEEQIFHVVIMIN